MVTKTVAIAQEQHGLGFQFGGADAVALRQRVVAGQGGQKGLVIEGRHRQTSVGKRLGHDGAIYFTCAQHLEQLHREIFLQHQWHLRRHIDAVAYQLGQQIRCDGVDNT